MSIGDRRWHPAGADRLRRGRCVVGRIGFPEPDCHTADTRKVNVFIAADYGLTGGADALGQLGMWIGSGGVRDRFGLAHEFTHALQVGSGGLQDSRYTAGDKVDAMVSTGLRDAGYRHVDIDDGWQGTC